MPRISSPSAQRNRAPILEVLRRHLPARGVVLEFASGTGEHIVYFAAALPALEFQPSDPDPAARESIASWIATTGVQNVRAPLDLDAVRGDWILPEEITRRLAAVLAINLVHIAPWNAALGLLRGAAKLLAPGGVLYLYGAYKRGGVHTAPSNAAFDASLRRENPEWGVRDLEAVLAAAAAEGFEAAEIAPMPANNLSVVLRRRGS